jgi:hypothetical protein
MPRPEGEAWKTGGYGTTVWHQRLDCGHVMSKKRKLKPEVDIDCPECQELEEQRRSFEGMPDPEVTDAGQHEYIEATVLGPDLDSVSSALERAAFSRAAIAHGLGVMVEQVEIVVGDTGIEGGMIVLGPGDVISLVQKLTRGKEK